MLRSLFAGITGLRGHQTMLDVVSNNIANVNTTGYKSSRLTFQESLTQVVRSGGRPNGDVAGTDPMQIGLGVTVAGTNQLFGQGSAQLTGRPTDVMINGDGFFVVEEAGERRYTRNGVFSVDSNGQLATSNGGLVQGWQADEFGDADFNLPVTPLQLPNDTLIEPVATTEFFMGGNLPASAPIGDTSTTSLTIYDSLGESQAVSVEFEKVGSNSWTATATPPAGSTPATLGPFGLTFDTDGNLTAPASGRFTLSGMTFPNGSAAQDVDVVLDGQPPVVQFGGTSSIEPISQDGSPLGRMKVLAIGNDGSITGKFSNGDTRVLGYVSIATFNNQEGLQRVGDSNWIESANSGTANVGRPADGTAGLLQAGTLEMSNVDLAQEFTTLILAQRGFQANSRSITTSDDVLQELVNIKR